MLKHTNESKRKTQLGTYFRVLSWILLSIVFLGTFAASLQILGNNEFLPFIIPTLLYLGYISDRYAKRLLAMDAHAVLNRDPNGFVLLLRSFRLDDGQVVPSLQPSFEESLMFALSFIGPVVAVGKPGEKLPPLGAARLYFDAEDWQAHVERLIQQARAVVLVLFSPGSLEVHGQGEGLKWEIEQAISQTNLEKILVVSPATISLLPQGKWPQKKKIAGAVQSSFAMFSQTLQSALASQFDKEAPQSPFLYFDTQKTMQPLQATWISRGCSSAGAFVCALRPFYKRLGVPEPTRNLILLQWRFDFFTRTIVVAVLCGLLGILLARFW